MKSKTLNYIDSQTHSSLVAVTQRAFRLPWEPRQGYHSAHHCCPLRGPLVENHQADIFVLLCVRLIGSPFSPLLLSSTIVTA